MDRYKHDVEECVNMCVFWIEVAVPKDTWTCLLACLLAFLIDLKVVLFQIAISVCSLCELSTKLVACLWSYTLCNSKWVCYTARSNVYDEDTFVVRKLCKYLKWFVRQVQNKSTNRFAHVATCDKRQTATVPLCTTYISRCGSLFVCTPNVRPILGEYLSLKWHRKTFRLIRTTIANLL